MQEMIKTQQELNQDIRDIQIEQTSAMCDLYESTRQTMITCLLIFLYMTVPVKMN